MSTKKTSLDKAMSWEGKTYGPGVVDLPEKAAAYAEKRKFGTIEGSASGDVGFEPLSFEKTFARFEGGDTAEEVYASLRYYQPIIAEAREKRISVQELLNQKSWAESSAEKQPEKQSDVKTENKSEKATGLPEDFPMRAAFEKAGFKSVADVQAKSREDLIAINGIAEASADKALSYGK